MAWPQSGALELPTSSPTLTDLAALAAHLDVTLHMAHLEHGLLGMYEPTEARVYFTFGLTHAEQRSVIAHELAHVHFGHTCSTPEAEREADKWAAELLITPAAYAEAEQHSHDPHDLAEALDVTVDVVNHYRSQCMQLVGTRAYGRVFRGRFTPTIARSLHG